MTTVLKKKPAPPSLGKKPAPPKPPAPKPAAVAPAPKAVEPKKPTPAPTAPKVEEPKKPLPKVEPQAPKVETPKPPKTSKQDTPQKQSKLDIMIEERLKEVKANDGKINRLKANISEIEESSNEVLRAITKLKRIRAMAKHIEAPYTWHMAKREGAEYNQSAWFEDYKYKTAAITFTIRLLESTAPEHKKAKFFVTIGGTKTIFGVSEQDAGHVEYSYVSNMYMERKDGRTGIEWVPSAEKGNVNLHQGYASEEEARKVIEQWQKRLVADHKELIDQERMLFYECME